MFRIPVAGKISVMVFDKTGTITKSGMDFTAVSLAMAKL
jgi:cation-transporting ATPase 13A3/4/5